jgi:hypothetical protein
MKISFKQTQLTHAALAQYHRWYQVYEVPFTANRIANQKDILADDVEISSPAGTTKGKAGLEERLSVYTGWQNAHHVQHTEVSLLPDGRISLEADIVYQNIRPDESKHSYAIHYSCVLQDVENGLPLFTKVDLKPTGNIAEFRFESAYAENRSKSFLHYWLYLMETGKSDKFKELLCADFSIQYGDGQLIDSFEKFETWLRASSESIVTGTHACKNIEIGENSDHTFSLAADLEWRGINSNNQEMRAESRYEWVLENELDERFARMKSMKINSI